ncbi:MAG: hypothetical protein WCR20_22600, partial [Verrucomicrobiota bacterium]
MRCRFVWGMGKAQLTSQAFHESTEAAELTYDKGRHRSFDTVFENGELVQTVLPDFARETDVLNNWLEPGEDLHGDGFEHAGATLKKLICWIVQADSKTPRHLSSIARRAVCLSFVV